MRRYPRGRREVQRHHGQHWTKGGRNWGILQRKKKGPRCLDGLPVDDNDMGLALYVAKLASVRTSIRPAAARVRVAWLPLPSDSQSPNQVDGGKVSRAQTDSRMMTMTVIGC